MKKLWIVLIMMTIITAATVTLMNAADDITWSIDAEGTLTVSGTGAMQDYNYAYAENIPWHERRNEIKTVVIEEGITAIGEASFYKCANLKSVFLPQSMKVIGVDAFYYCTELENVNIPAGVLEIGKSAFSWCTSLEDFYVPDTVMGVGEFAFNETAYYNNEENWENGVLYKDKHLVCVQSLKAEEYYVKDGTLTIADAAFGDCGNLKKIIIPDSVRVIGNSAFDGCVNLCAVIMGNGIKRIEEYAFYDNYKLAYVDYNGTEADWETVEIGKNNAGVSLAKKLFVASPELCCSGVCGDYLTWTLDKAGLLEINGFGDMYDYTQLSIPWYTDRYNITDVKIGDLVKKIGNHAFYDCSNLIGVVMPQSLTKIGGWAFYGCDNLTEIDIPEMVKMIYTEAFAYCHRLERVSLKEGLTHIYDGVFSNCTSLSEIELPESLEYIGQAAFYCCQSLTGIYIPSYVSYIGEEAFKCCYSLGWFDVSYSNETYCTYDGLSLMSYDSTKLISYAIGYDGDHTYDVPNTVKVIGDSAFYGDINLHTVYIPEGVTAIGALAFSDCEVLKTVQIPETVASIGEGAFSWSEELTDINLPEGIKKVENYTFYGCGALKEINLPVNVTQIGWRAFDRSGLCDVYYGGNAEQWANVSIDEYNEPLLLANMKWAGAVEQIEIDRTEILLMPGQTEKLNATVLPDSAINKNVVWSSSDESVVTVNEGAVSAVNYGVAEVSVTTEEGGYTAVCLVKVVEGGFCGDGVLWHADEGRLVISGEGAMYDYSSGQPSPWSRRTNISSVWIGAGVTGGCENAFLGMPALKEINVDCENEVYSSDKGVLHSKDETVLWCYPAGKTDKTYTVWNPVYTIAQNAFSENIFLKSLTLSGSVKNISDSAFENNVLTDIYYGNSKADWETAFPYPGDETLRSTTIHLIMGEGGVIEPKGETVVLLPECISINGVEEECALTVMVFENGAFAGVKTIEVEENVTVKMDETGLDMENVNSVKVFLWESMESMRPLCEAKSIYITK